MASLRLPFIVVGIYGVIVGIVQLFPALTEVVFGRPVVDLAVESTWGATLIALGLVILAAARVAEHAMALAWAVVAGLAIQAAAIVYWWAAGEYAAATAIPPLVINLALAAWLAYVASRPGAAVRPASGRAGAR